MGPVLVVVRLVLAQRLHEMSLIPDQGAVQEFVAAGPYPVGFQNAVTDSEQGLLRGLFVFVDQPAEDWAASDPLVGQVDDGPVGSWRPPLQRPMWPPAVVMTGIFIECPA
jgi:hypothetical protein